MLRVLAINGSLRQGSHNAALLRAAPKMALVEGNDDVGAGQPSTRGNGRIIDLTPDRGTGSHVLRASLVVLLSKRDDGPL